MKHPELFDNEVTNITAKLKGEYFLGFIEGGFGDGKTLGIVMLANETKHNYDKIWANFTCHIKNAEYLDELNKHTLLNLSPDKNERGLLLLQESYHYFDKRHCTKAYQKEIMDDIFQIRKTGIDILCDIRELKYLDFRAVENTTLFMRANGKLKINPHIFEYQTLKAFPLRNYIFFEPINTFYIDGRKYYNLYDTLGYTKQERKVKDEQN